VLELKSEQQPASSDGLTTSREEVERITRIVLAVLDARSTDAGPPGQEPWPKRLGRFLLSQWQLTALLLAAAALMIATAVYGTSPLYYVKQLAINDQELDAKSREFDYSQRMAARYIALGTSLLDQGRFEDAEDAFAEALAFDPHSVAAQLGKHKARVFAPSAGGEFDPAVIEQRITSVFADPGTGQVEDPHALAALGDLMYDTHRYDAAHAYFERAIQNRPVLATLTLAWATSRCTTMTSPPPLRHSRRRTS
jgi:tetratricopeptide (TPR) repeat protein